MRTDELLEAGDVRLLADIGFFALSAGLVSEAGAIFEGVRAARPAHEAGPLGLAMVQMARDDLDAAISTLRALPPTDAALTYLGLALARHGDVAEASGLFGNVVETAPGTPFAEIAAAGLEDMKRKGSPKA